MMSARLGISGIALALWAGSADAAAFRDANLEAAIRIELDEVEGVLTADLLASMRQLSARGAGIQHLDGIEQLTGLVALDLAGNHIVDLEPLASLTDLQLLDLEDNRIQNLSPLSGLASLQFVALNSNQISGIGALVDLPALASVATRRPC